MTETKEGIQPEKFVLNIETEPENPTPEIQEALDWYKERLSTLPEMRVTEATATDGNKWRAEMAENGEVNKIVGAQFRIEGRSVASSFSWDQPLIEQRTEQASTPDGKTVEISGIVILARDSKGRVLLSVVNEPGSDRVDLDGKELHPAVRTPIQTSVQKLKDLSEGKPVDETMKAALSVLTSPTHTFADVVRSLRLRKTPTDGNRMHSNVYYASIDVDDVTVRDLEEKTGGKFLSHEQINALEAVNGHAHIAHSRTS